MFLHVSSIVFFIVFGGFDSDCWGCSLGSLGFPQPNGQFDSFARLPAAVGEQTEFWNPILVGFGFGFPPLEGKTLQAVVFRAAQSKIGKTWKWKEKRVVTCVVYTRGFKGSPCCRWSFFKCFQQKSIPVIVTPGRGCL